MHSKNIIHWDIKCLNLFLDKYERIKIGDLGVSKLLGQGTANLTAKGGQWVGTPLYLSP